MHRVNTVESPECPCDGENQTVDRLLYDCTKLQRVKDKLISNASKQDNWPLDKSDLVKKKTQNILFCSQTQYILRNCEPIDVIR